MIFAKGIIIIVILALRYATEMLAKNKPHYYLKICKTFRQVSKDILFASLLYKDTLTMMKFKSKYFLKKSDIEFLENLWFRFLYLKASKNLRKNTIYNTFQFISNKFWRKIRQLIQKALALDLH